MNIQEQNYANHLLFIGDPHLCSLSWNNIVQASPSTQEEVDFYNYWIPLMPAQKEDAEYEVFSFMYDNTDPILHEPFKVEFGNVNYNLDGFCQRKKKPAK